jgi:hypothetical protein
VELVAERVGVELADLEKRVVKLRARQQRRGLCGRRGRHVPLRVLRQQIDLLGGERWQHQLFCGELLDAKNDAATPESHSRGALQAPRSGRARRNPSTQPLSRWIPTMGPPERKSEGEGGRRAAELGVLVCDGSSTCATTRPGRGDVSAAVDGARREEGRSTCASSAVAPSAQVGKGNASLWPVDVPRALRSPRPLDPDCAR